MGVETEKTIKESILCLRHQVVLLMLTWGKTTWVGMELSRRWGTTKWHINNYWVFASSKKMCAA
jgi:hypothetical protein